MILLSVIAYTGWLSSVSVYAGSNDTFRIQYWVRIGINRGIHQGTHMVSKDIALQVKPCTKTKMIIEIYP